MQKMFQKRYFVLYNDIFKISSAVPNFFAHEALQKLINSCGALMKPKFANFKFYEEIVFRACSLFKMHTNVSIIRKILKNI